MKNKLINLLAPVVMIAGGLLFCFLGVRNLSDVRSLNPIPAVVSDIEYTYNGDAENPDSQSETVYVSYRVNGKDYNEILQFARGGHKTGERLTVLNDPEKPEYVSEASKREAAVYLGFGTLIAVGGIAVLWKNLRKTKSGE